MKTVWKYEIPVSDSDYKITMPMDSTMLHVGTVGIGWLALWVEVDTSVPTETRTFRVTGTGHPLPEVSPLTYLGTVQETRTELVWHLYEFGDPR